MEDLSPKTAPKVDYSFVIPNTPIRFLFHVTKPHKWWALGALLAVTLGQGLGASVPYIFRSIIDTAQSVSAGAADIERVWFWVFLYPLTTALVFISWRVNGFIAMQWVTRSNATAYQKLFEYLLHHSHTYFTNRFAGSVSSKVAHASEGTQSLAEAFVWNYYSTIISLIFTVGYMMFANVLAGAIFLMLLLFLIPLNIYLARYRRPYVVEFSEQATRARGYAVDSITNMSAVRQFARRKDELALFGKEIEKMRTLNIRQWRISEWSLALNSFIVLVFEALVILIAVHSWTTGAISIGTLVMMITLLINVQGSLLFIGNSINGFIRRYGEIEEGLTDILSEHEVLDAPDATPLISKEGKIEWKNVTFDYGAYLVFEKFSVTIRGGERVGLVGPSGAGKSTFVSLLLRQHDIEEGEICIDGQNISEVTQDSLRENIAVVPQEPALFHRSIRENIGYGKPDASLEEIIEVAKKAQAHEFISKLPEGYDTLVGERGVKLSGGQRQRIAIARAMLKDAPILILDEATSALDSESEVAIQKALRELMEGKTVVAIAHRLSTLREMDRLIVLEHGVIVEDGTHAELVQGSGAYSRLWTHQAGGFLQD